MTAPADKPASPLRLWLIAGRTNTLVMSAVPVLTGSALAAIETGQFRWPVALFALLSMCAIHLAMNLYNDARDFLIGVDGPDHLGPPSAVRRGWLTPEEMTTAAVYSAFFAITAGAPLVWLGGWPILMIGIAGIGLAFAYSAGARPLAASPLGEIIIIASFGVAAVAGTAMLHTGGRSDAAIVLGLAVGAYAAAVLMVNNHRDRLTDARAGRRTLAILLGHRGSTIVYAVLVLGPYASVPLLANADSCGNPAYLPWITLPLAGFLVITFDRAPISKNLNRLLPLTILAQIAFTAAVLATIWGCRLAA